MIRPLRARSMPCVARLTTRNEAVRFASTTAEKSASLIRRRRVSFVIPAFDTRISTGPNLSSTALKAASTSSVLVTSHLMPNRPSGGGEELYVTATWSPSAANRRAQASPMPREPPVTSTTRLIARPTR